MKTILLLGAAGYVGSAFAKYLSARGLDFRSASRRELDYTTRPGMRDLLDAVRPVFVINAAGYTGKPNVDGAERDRANCLLGNAVLPGLLREECETRGIAWGHVSSGCIFTGRRSDSAGFNEKDAPNFSFRRPPCSFYSGSKALGEEALGFGESEDRMRWEHPGEPGGYIWRLRIPFDNIDNPRNYLTKLMSYKRLLDAENSISQLDAFVEACFRCWENDLPRGVYHVTNPGSVWTRQIVSWIRQSPVGRRLEAEGKRFVFFRDEAEFMREAAIAPRSNCVLDSTKLQQAGIALAPVEEAICQALANWSR